MMGRGGRRDRGAVSTIVVTLFFCGGSSVILAMLAMSVDVGNVLAERRQLQNGADAASMMLAQQCAKKNTAVCAPGVVSGIANIASANAADQKSAIASVCFNNVPGVSIQPCPTSANSDAGDLGKCNPLPLGVPATTSYVQVTTSTLTDSGSTLFTPFARALASSGSGPTVIACARAAWGPPKGTGPTLPLIITRCAYDGSTASGTKLVRLPRTRLHPRLGLRSPASISHMVWGSMHWLSRRTILNLATVARQIAG